MNKAGIIGILLDPHVLKRIPAKRTGTERILFYHRAAKSLGLSVIFTSLPLIHFSKGCLTGYVYKEKRWVRKTVPIPRVFHNRAMPFDAQGKRRLRQLCSIAEVFNRRTRYSKLRVHRILAGDPYTQSYVPDTVKLTESNLKKMMGAYKDLFIKPVSGSVGLGIISITQNGSGNWVIHQEGSKKKNLPPAEARKAVLRRVRPKEYLIQEGVRLARYKNKPFDLRVSVQRDGKGEWSITGSVGKVAAKGKRVTNLARGGKAIAPEKLYQSLGWNAYLVNAQVNEAALRAANTLGKRLKGLADIGFDIGLSASGKPYIIEMNGRDQRYSFLKAGMKDTFYKTYHTPIAYAAYLLQPGIRTSGRRKKKR